MDTSHYFGSIEIHVFCHKNILELTGLSHETNRVISGTFIGDTVDEAVKLFKDMNDKQHEVIQSFLNELQYTEDDPELDEQGEEVANG